MPNDIISVYNGLLPTWFYGFQFSVNLQPANSVGLVSSTGLTLALVALLVAGVAAWAAWERRVVIGYRRYRLLSAGAEASAETQLPAGQDAAAPTPVSPTGPTPPTDAPAAGTARRSRKDKPEN
jgi:hypothetical protein